MSCHLFKFRSKVDVFVIILCKHKIQWSTSWIFQRRLQKKFRCCSRYFPNFHVFKCDLYSPTFLFIPLYNYFMCNKFEHLTYILYNSLGKCSLGNGNAAPLGFTTLYLRASPPQNCKQLLYFRIEFHLMITVPTHKHH